MKSTRTGLAFLGWLTFLVGLVLLNCTGLAVGGDDNHAPIFLPQITMIKAGTEHTIALRSDGTVWTWGSNNSGQLGDGTSISRSMPFGIRSLAGIIAVSTAGDHNLALGNDGNVWAWGFNNKGQLGDGTRNSRNLPVRVNSLGGVTAVSACSDHSIALRNDGTVWAWGGNARGQLGDGTKVDRALPVQVPGLAGITAVAGGWQHSLALRSDGTVWIWGGNDNGQLGDGTATDSPNPLQVPGLTGIIAVSARWICSMALKSDGAVWVWGDGIMTPQQVPDLIDIRQISRGSFYSLALDGRGRVWGWGDNNGQMGEGIGESWESPVLLPAMAGTKTIEAGENHTLLIRNDGAVWACGSSGNGELGDGLVNVNPVFRAVPGLLGIAAVAGGGQESSFALGNDGVIWSWGQNRFGMLGDGTGIDRSQPVMVGGQAGFKSISGGQSHAVAVRYDGSVWAWGSNGDGQLGDGGTRGRWKPVTVPGFTDAAMAAAGDGFTAALKNDGTVWTWGRNGFGELGNGTNSGHRVPGQVPYLRDIVSLAVGVSHVLAVRGDGTVWAWGMNDTGQLGIGSHMNSNVPTQVRGLTGVTMVAAGYGHSLALKSDGTIWAWGGNGHGNLGDDSLDESAVPVQVRGLSGARCVGAGFNHSLAVADDGSLWTWGRNEYGQLGYITAATSGRQPCRVPDVSGVIAAAGGRYHSILLKNDGSVWTCGYNGHGQLGDGMPVYRLAPVPVQWPEAIGDLTATVEETLQFTVDALDPDGDPLTYGASNLPAGAIFDPLSRVFSWTPDRSQTGIHEVRFTASDGALSSSEIVTIRVYAAAEIALLADDCAYSDPASFAATLTSGGAPVPGQTIAFNLGGVDLGTSVTDPSGRAVLARSLDLPVGTYEIEAALDESGTGYYRAAPATGRLRVVPEQARLVYTGQTVVAQPGPVDLAAKVTQEEDGTPGSLALAQVRFTVFLIGPDGHESSIGAYTAPCDGLGGAAVQVSLDVGLYRIKAELAEGGYFAADPAAATAAVLNSAGGSATGGGWFRVEDPAAGLPGRTNLGFTIRYRDGAATGHLELQSKDAGIDLKVRQFDWLIAQADTVYFQGTGTIKGWNGVYTVRVSCSANQGPGCQDRITVTIWAGADTNAAPVYWAANQALMGGNIQVRVE